MSHSPGRLPFFPVISMHLPAQEELDVIMREISMMAQSASCPQMTRYFSSQVVGSNLHIVMEYMGGGAVSDLVCATRFPLQRLFRPPAPSEFLTHCQYCIVLLRRPDQRSASRRAVHCRDCSRSAARSEIPEQRKQNPPRHQRFLSCIVSRRFCRLVHLLTKSV